MSDLFAENALQMEIKAVPALQPVGSGPNIIFY